MTDRAQRAQEEARQRLLHDIELANAQIVTIQRQLEVQDDLLAKMNADEATNANVLVRTENPREIAAEDALDHIVSLENTLKITQRRNTLLQRENATQAKNVKDRVKVLERLVKEEDSIAAATGWSVEDDVPHTDVEQLRAGILEMQELEQAMRKEIVTGEVVLHKKQQTATELEAKLAVLREREEEYGVLCNDVRVRERDCRELEREISEIQDEHSSNDQLIEDARSKRGVVSIQNLQDDTSSLKATVEQQRAIRRKQDDVVKAQLFRARQLQTRIDIITAALKDMKLEKEFERSAPRSSLVPGAAKDEPSDVAEVIPENEMLPVETYLLLLRDNEAMRTSVARKDVMVLEKEATVQALDAKLESFTHSLNLSTEQQDSLKLHKALEMDELQEQLQEQHQAYRKQIEELLSTNLKLKARIKKSTVPVFPPQTLVNGKEPRMKFA
ncbi:Hypothetical protein, putative [Bodo saltans]|uniref:Uncharacterized protein n=1 Tax=Bodo saltans TaxID=75058 RepID=A0A0S4JDF0_BODSA|nr:Hypothetical protein, putative [Bodo saltans]|eukprot:CUG89603.1 Hypothetical protein, putative [Bodo saltans]